METKFSIPFSIAAVALAFLMGSLQAYAAEFGTEAGADQSAYASVFNAMDVDDDGTRMTRCSKTVSSMPTPTMMA